MDDFPQKTKKRAMRRKRNHIAKDLKMNKLYRPKTIQPKKRRNKVTVKEVEEFLVDHEL